MDSAKTEKRRRHMRIEEQLPRVLIEEILSRVSPKSLLRFRVVCKQWKAIMDDKTFISNHKETFRFILTTESKIYSVSIDPKIVVCELTPDIPSLEYQNPRDMIDSDEFLICSMDEGAAVWNPWLNHSVWITHQPGFFFEGICYNGSTKKSDEVPLYKTLWRNNTKWKSHGVAFSAWGDANFKYEIGVSLNGSLFWVAYRDKTDPLYCLVNFNFSKGKTSRFCKLPCRMSHPRDALVLRVFKGDRFSVLKQCHVTKKIEIWVTKNKVNVEDGNDVVWMNFMTLSIPDFPRLVPIGCYSRQPSYYIDDKRLVVCSCDENGQAWIHVLGENKLISKVQLDSVVGFWPSHCTYFPSLVPVPRGLNDEAEFY